MQVRPLRQLIEVELRQRADQHEVRVRPQVGQAAQQVLVQPLGACEGGQLVHAVIDDRVALQVAGERHGLRRVEPQHGVADGELAQYSFQKRTLNLGPIEAIGDARL